MPVMVGCAPYRTLNQAKVSLERLIPSRDAQTLRHAHRRPDRASPRQVHRGQCPRSIGALVHVRRRTARRHRHSGPGVGLPDPWRLLGLQLPHRPWTGGRDVRTGSGAQLLALPRIRVSGRAGERAQRGVGSGKHDEEARRRGQGVRPEGGREGQRATDQGGVAVASATGGDRGVQSGAEPVTATARVWLALRRSRPLEGGATILVRVGSSTRSFRPGSEATIVRHLCIRHDWL
jgi:hypothetical protein